MAPSSPGLSWSIYYMKMDGTGKSTEGTCYSFATVAMAEFHHAKKTGEFVTLSTQNLIDSINKVYRVNNSITGLEFALRFGLVEEKDYPYRGIQEISVDRWLMDIGRPRVHVYGKLKLLCSEDEIRQAIREGPLLVEVNSTDNFFKYCPSDMVYDTPIKEPDHDLVAVSHGMRDLDGREFVVLRNSWGYGFCDGGHIKVAISILVEHAWTLKEEVQPATLLSCNSTNANHCQAKRTQDLAEVIQGRGSYEDRTGMLRLIVAIVEASLYADNPDWSVDEQVAKDVQLIDAIAERQAQISSEECKLFPADVQIQSIYPLPDIADVDSKLSELSKKLLTLQQNVDDLASKHAYNPDEDYVEVERQLRSHLESFLVTARSFNVIYMKEIRPRTHMMEVLQLHGFGPAANRLLEAYKMLLKFLGNLRNLIRMQQWRLMASHLPL